MRRSNTFASDPGGDSSAVTTVAPGKRTLTASIQRRAEPAPAMPREVASGPPEAASDPFWFATGPAIADSGSSLPHLETIQRAFGDHDVSGIVSHVGGAAEEGAAGLGAVAYATGHHVAFAAPPDLHTAAHEAAHVVQQRGGVQLAGGVGADGDAYERHADAVADAVLRGEPVGPMLDQLAPSGASRPAVVQRKLKFPIDAGDEHVATDADDLVEFLVERFPQRSEAYLAGTIKSLQEHGRVYATWEDVVEAVTAPKVSVQAESIKPVERDAAMLLSTKTKDSSLVIEAAVAARTYLREELDRANPTAEEIVRIGEPMIRIYTRVGSVLLNGVLSPKKLQERGLAFTGSSDKSQDVDKISAWDIDLDRNEDKHYEESEKPVGHRSISVAIERENDVELCGADVCARAGKADVGAQEIVAKAKLPELVAKAVNDGTYVTKFATQLRQIHLNVGTAARVDPKDHSLTRDAQAEMTDRAFHTAMFVSTGSRLDDHGPKQATLAPTSTELRTASELPPEALSHVLVPGFMKWLPSLTTLATECDVDLRFVGQTKAKVLYYDFSSRTQATSEIDVPDFQSELQNLWDDDNRKMIAHITRT